MLPPLSRDELDLPGAGGAVLLVHGLGGGPYELQRLGEHLHRALGWTVRALQLPGHRQAGTWMPHSTWPQWLAGVEEALDRLERDTGVAGVHLVAFSMGTLPALRLAARGRLKGALVLLAPFLAVFRPWGLSLDWATRLARSVPRRPPPLRDPARRREVQRCVPFRMFSVASARSALELARQVLAEAGQVKVPCLVLQGDRDTVVDAAGAARLAARLGGPHRLEVIRGSDHLLALDSGQAEVFALTAAFLAAQG